MVQTRRQAQQQHQEQQQQHHHHQHSSPLLLRKYPLRLVAALAVFVGSLFGLSHDHQWRPACGIVAMTVVCYTAATAVVLRTNPSLWAERAAFTQHSNCARFDKMLAPAVVVLGVSSYVVAGLEHAWRLKNNSIEGGGGGGGGGGLLGAHAVVCMDAAPAPAAALAWAAELAALALSSAAIATNRWFSSVVRLQHDRGPRHEVCRAGCYAWVRHPAYVAYAAQGFAEAALLCSSLAFALAVARLVVLVVRTVCEERYLRRHLQGYAAYQQAVRWRWLPLVW